MDISLYPKICSALDEYVKENYTDFSVDVLTYEPKDPVYPLIIFSETRNQPYGDTKGFFERVASLGYRLDIFANTKNGLDKLQVCRELASICDFFLTRHVGLRQVSWNTNARSATNGELCQIIITYSTAYHENKQRIL